MKVEIYRCWQDNTWDTEVIDLPDISVVSKKFSSWEQITDQKQLDELVGIYLNTILILNNCYKNIVIMGIYHYPDDGE